MSNNIPRNKWLWSASLLFFIIAGCTGVMFRIGMTGLDFFGLSLQNIRHAHSHLMFFGWAGLVPLVIMYDYVRSTAEKAAHSGMKYSLISILVLSPITYVFFLLWGYHPVSIGEAQLPLSAIFSSFVMIAWYAFAFWFFRTGKSINNGFNNWMKTALIMLMISSIGAWGVGALQVLKVENIFLSKGMAQFFLGTFTEGWVVLVVIGMITKSLRLTEKDFKISSSAMIGMIAFGAPLTFAYGINYSILTPALLWSARIGGMLSSVAALLFVFGAIRKCKGKYSIWFWPIVLLGIKAAIQLLVSFNPNQLWLADHNLRILYLHILLLGAFSIASFAWIHSIIKSKPPTFIVLVFSCLAVLGSLVLPTGLIPISLKGVWIFYTLIIVAMLPVLAAIYLWVQIQLNLTFGD